MFTFQNAITTLNKNLGELSYSSPVFTKDSTLNRVQFIVIAKALSVDIVSDITKHIGSACIHGA